MKKESNAHPPEGSVPDKPSAPHPVPPVVTSSREQALREAAYNLNRLQHTVRITHMEVKDLIEDLATHGGAIVSSDDCTELEIQDARITKRFAVNPEGLGFVRRTKKWLDIQKERETTMNMLSDIISKTMGSRG